MVKIAISGKANSGKNTVAYILKEMLGENTTIAALADHIKEIIKIMVPSADKNCLYGDSKLRSTVVSDKFKDADGAPLTYRRMCTDIGALGRKYNENIWIDCLIEDAKISNSNLIVPDVRMINEFEYLKQSDFVMIRVIRNDCSNGKDISETEQDLIDNDKFDLVVYNNGSLEDLSIFLHSNKNKWQS